MRDFSACFHPQPTCGETHIMDFFDPPYRQAQQKIITFLSRLRREISKVLPYVRQPTTSFIPLFSFSFEISNNRYTRVAPCVTDSSSYNDFSDVLVVALYDYCSYVTEGDVIIVLRNKINLYYNLYYMPIKHAIQSQLLLS